MSYTKGKMYYHEYYSELVKYGEQPYKIGKINLVAAPAGSGKSYHCCKMIEKYSGDKDIYYVTDTTMLRESISKDLPEHVKTITYSRLGMILGDSEQREQFFNNTYMLFLDEVHQLFRYARKFNKDENCDSDKMYYKFIISCLYELPKYMRVIALSATAGDLLNHTFYENESHMLNNVLSDDIIKQLYQQNIDNELKVLKISEWLENDFKLAAGEQALGYTSTIDDLITYKSILENKGYTVGVLWSKNASGYTPNQIDRMFTDEQEQLYEYVKNNNEIPDDIDVLLINAAYESGWNLENNGLKRIQTVFINTSDIVTIIQVSNRVRHDIKLQVVTQAVPKESDFLNREWVDGELNRLHKCLKDKWHDSYLLCKADRDSLCEDLSFLYGSRRIIKTYKPLTEYIERLYQYNHFNHFDNKGFYYIPFDEFIANNMKYINRPFAIDLVLAYDDEGKPKKDSWQIRHNYRGVYKGDRRSLFQKVQYLKCTGYHHEPKAIAEKLEVNIKLVNDNWEQQFKYKRNPNKDKSNKDKKADRRLQIQELKDQGLTQKQIADKLGISSKTVQRHWNK